MSRSHFRRASAGARRCLPGSDITIDDLYTENLDGYPRSTGWSSPVRSSRTINGRCLRQPVQIKDPFLQQGGDMVRVGGFSYAAPGRPQWRPDHRQRLTGSGELLEAGKPTRRWLGVGERKGSKSLQIYELMEDYITKNRVTLDPDAAAVRVMPVNPDLN